MQGLRHALSGATATVRAVRIIRSSGTFDEQWYRSQVPGGVPRSTDPIKHYVREGAAAGLSPNPLFSPAYYLAQAPTAERSTLGPFVHYLRLGTIEGRSPHPAFDLEYYLSQAPQAHEHPGGALGHFLEVGWRNWVKINEWFSATAYKELHPHAGEHEPAILDLLRRAAAWLADVPDHRSFPRLYDEFDHERARCFVVEMSELAGRGDGPLVTVVMPVRDRVDTIGTAIGSVLEQTYEPLELLVVDDGSVDGTPDVVSSFDDPRVRLIRQEPTGVCRARNRAISEAAGTYVAYLDSDNTWEPGFLATMVAFLESTEHDVAYSGLAIERQGRASYRGAPLDRAALLEANYIDCNTLVHQRQLAEAIGGWDEALRRANDWDFTIRITAVGNVGYAPFIGVRYDHDRQRGDRITVREPFGYKFKVYAKHHFDWTAIGAEPDVTGLTSIVVPIVTPGADLRTCLEAIAETTSEDEVEVLVVDNSPAEVDAIRAFEVVEHLPNARLIRPTWMQLTLPVVIAYGIAEARGDVVVVVDPAVAVQPGWLAPLAAPVRSGHAAMTQGPLLGSDGGVACAGYLVGANGVPYPGLAGFPELGPEAATAADRQGLCASLLAVGRQDLIAAEGFDPLFRAVLADVDLTLRIRARTGRATRYVPGAGAALLEAAPGPDTAVVEQDQQVFSERWSGHLVVDEDAVLSTMDLRVTRRRPSGSRWASPDAYEPVVERITDRERPLRWAIKIAPFDVGMRRRWGDWHFGLALRQALLDLGHEVVVDLRDGWYRPTSHLDDVVLVLRGNGRYRLDPDHLNLVWLISHPDMPGDDELARYDHRFVASERHARKVRARIDLPTDPMLQCTDARRFVPGPELADAEEVLFVGNSRGSLRPIVADALAAGLPIGVYGAHWKRRVPKAVWRAKHVPNDQLPALYRSAGVVLNDHWDDMRREAFLSNRLFDLAACGANIVSDHIEGLHETFGDTVRTYDRSEELAEVVEDALACREAEREQRLALSERIREEHSFAARARELDRVARELLTRIDDRRQPSSARASG